jgi:HD-GYP domain-containing protein (c-di-GMP phosphodiesterase class II)
MAEMCGACTPGHAQGVSDAAVLLASHRGMGRRRVAALAEAAWLLDIGMVDLAPHFARRSRPLTYDEEESFQLHPIRSLQIVREFALTAEGYSAIARH